MIRIKALGLSSCRLNQGCQGRSLISELPEQLLLQTLRMLAPSELSLQCLVFNRAVRMKATSELSELKRRHNCQKVTVSEDVAAKAVNNFHKFLEVSTSFFPLSSLRFAKGSSRNPN
jgi:hypothetical protein